MATLGTTEFNALLKKWYGREVMDLINKETYLLNLIEKSTTSWSGEQMIDPVKLTVGQGVGARAEKAALPTAINSRTIKSITDAKYMYGVMELTGQVISRSKVDKGAFKKAVAYEMEDTLTSLKLDRNRVFWGNGTGRLAEIAGVAGNVITLTAPPTGEGMRYLKLDMHIDTVSGGAVVDSDLTITAVDFATNSITVSAPPAAVAGDTLIRTGNLNNEPMGMFGLISDGDIITDPNEVQVLQNIDRSTYDAWKANVIRVGGNLTEKIMQQAVDLAGIRGSGEVNRITGDYSLRTEYVAGAPNLLNQKRFLTTELKGGYERITFNGIPVDVDKDCPYGTLFFWNTNYIEHAELSPLDWDDEDGQILRQVEGYDIWRAHMKVYDNVKTLKPHCMTKVNGINSTVVGVPV